MPPLCRRAVQRSVKSSTDNFWITDDVLATAFQRFCALTRPSRRHGSSVPGPMECRRRVGKRRMAHLVQAGNAPMFDVGALFGGFGTVDRTEWRWEPPTARPKAHKDDTKLPVWLTDDLPLPQPNTALFPAASAVTATSRSRNYEEQLDEFLEAIRVADKDVVQRLCRRLNHDFKQGLLLGDITEDIVLSALQLVPRDLQNPILTEKETALLCVEFLKSIWKGYQACKVLKLQDVGTRIFDTLLCNLAKIQTNQKTLRDGIQAIATEILDSVSVGHLVNMSNGIDSIVEWWVMSWLDQHLLISDEMEIPPSVLALSTLLGSQPSEFLGQSLPRLTEQVVKVVRTRTEPKLVELVSFKRSWALMVASLPNLRQDIFVRTWKALDTLMGQKSQVNSSYTSANVMPFTEKEGIALIIEYWMNHGQFKDSKRIRGSYLFKRQIHYHGHVADLLAAIDRRRDGCWTQARGLFALFREVGMDDMIPKTLEYAPKIGLKVPASLIAAEIRELSLQKKMITALKVYKTYPDVRFDNIPLGIDGLHDMIIGCIKNRGFHPLHVWGMCRIYLSMPGAMIRRPAQRERYNYRKPTKPLGKERVALIKKMAEAFAHATHLYSGASNCPAYRNVRQCVRYLSLHNQKPSVEVSKALVHIGIVKPLKAGHGPATERLRYILAYVREAEGEDVAYGIDAYVQKFRDQRLGVQEEGRRLQNPLRLGMID